jgi:TPR repeat protein
MKRHLIGTCLSMAVLFTSSLPALADWEVGLSSYRHGDFATALKEFQNDGSAESNFYLSIMYEMGQGTAQDREKALELLQTAAEKGLDVAQADLGLIYLEGKGVPKDEERAFKWLRKAADQGLPEARMAMQTEHR